MISGSSIPPLLPPFRCRPFSMPSKGAAIGFVRDSRRRCRRRSLGLIGFNYSLIARAPNCRVWPTRGTAWQGYPSLLPPSLIANPIWSPLCDDVHIKIMILLKLRLHLYAYYITQRSIIQQRTNLVRERVSENARADAPTWSCATCVRAADLSRT